MELVNLVLIKFNALRAKLQNDESGATALEYGLLAALVAIVLIAGATLFGNALSLMFTNLAVSVGAVKTAP